MGGSETLRMIYTADRVRASGPAGRSTEPIRETYRMPYPSATPRSSLSAPLPFTYTRSRNLCSCMYARVHVNTHHHKIPQCIGLRQTAPRRQHNAANTKTPIRSEPKLLCRERLLRPTPFLHTTIQPAVYIWICFFFLPIRRSLLLLGWTRAFPLPFISGRAIRDTESWPKSLPTGQLLCPQYFLMLPPGIR